MEVIVNFLHIFYHVFIEIELSPTILSSSATSQKRKQMCLGTYLKYEKSILRAVAGR